RIAPASAQIRGAHRAEAGAILATEHLERSGQHEGVASPGGQIEGFVVHVGAFQLLPVTWPVDLARRDGDARAGRLQAAHARAAANRDRTHPPARPSHSRLAAPRAIYAVRRGAR